MASTRPCLAYSSHRHLIGSFEREGTRRVESQRECSGWRSSMKRTTVVPWIGLAVALVIGGTLLAQAKEPLFGTWKLNVAKSKFSPGPASKSSSSKWEATQDGVKLTVDTVPASGEPI